MKLIAAAIMLFAFLVSPAMSAARGDGVSKKNIPKNKIEALIENSMKKGHIPGAAVAIVDHGEITYLQGFGQASLEWPSPVAPDTKFQVASTTKALTAVLLLAYVEKGRIDLNAPVTDYIPDAPDKWRSITIRHLSQHTTGLGSMEPDADIEKISDAVKIALTAEVVAAPGEISHYGAWDFTILQYILEQVSGKPFPQLMHDELLSPLGMNFTQFENAKDYGTERIAETLPHRASNYAWNGSKNQTSWYLYPPYTYAAGGAFSSAQDMARFIKAIDTYSVLGRATAELLWTPARLVSGDEGEFGVGWVAGSYRGRRYGGHSGGPALADMLYFPDDRLGIVVLTNQKMLTPVIAYLLADELLSPPNGYFSAGIEDAASDMTKNALKLIEQMQRGDVSVKLVQNDNPRQAENLSRWGEGWLNLFEPVSGIALLSDETLDDNSRFRRYRFTFGEHVQNIGIQTNENGRVMGLAPEGDATE